MQGLEKIGSNTYEVALPAHLGISLIFNISNMTPYNGNVDEGKETNLEELEEDITTLPSHARKKLEMILDTKIIKKTRKNIYMKYLMKCERYAKEEVSWMDEANIKRNGTCLQEIMSKAPEIN